MFPHGSDLLQILLYLVVLSGVTPVLGRFVARIATGQRTFLTPILAPLERVTVRLARIEPGEEMSWRHYAFSLLVFNGVGILFLYVLQTIQAWLPLNPQALPYLPWHLAFNIAVSFVTNTNWQSYAGETTLTYAVQTAGLTVQNFVSAATGAAVAFALTRGLARQMMNTIGNFWIDLIRVTLYILLPLSLLWAVVLASQGVVQTFSGPITVTTLEGDHQIIPVGPVASQVAIKQLGTNGGGYYNANSAFPFENPTPLSNFIEMLAILLLPSAGVHAFGSMIGRPRQGWVIWGAMMVLLLLGIGVSLFSEVQGIPALPPAGSLEGKEVRTGLGNSVLWSVATTAASNGSTNAAQGSLSPLSGMVAMVNIMLGEVVFGGVGAGLYGMLVFVLLTVFLAGLMVGRTPEYLGKKIESFEVKMAALAVLTPSAVILAFAGVAAATPAGFNSVGNQGPHGLSEILYAFSSAAGNNGSAFAGLNANTPFYNILLGVAMLVGRFGVIVPVLAIAGGLAGKKATPASSGTFPTDTVLFAILLVSVIMIVGALTFFPALSLGPIVEQLLLQKGAAF